MQDKSSTNKTNPRTHDRKNSIQQEKNYIKEDFREINEDDLDEINKIIDEEPMPLMTDGD